MAIVKRLVKGSELTYEELDGNFTDLDGRVTTAQQTADAIVERTRKPIPNTTQYTLIAADYTDFYLDFTANLGQTIALNINTGIIPTNGQAQIISSGNNFIVPTAGTGITFIKPPETNLKTVGKGSWLGIIETTTADSLSINGSLESTAPGGGEMNVQPDWNITDNTLDSFILNKPDIPAAEIVFTNSEDGLVPAPNVSGTTTYSGAITSPAEGFTITEGVLITVTASESSTLTPATPKVLEDIGWVDRDLRKAKIIPFIIKWTATSDVAITLPIGSNDVGLVNIDWGDGTINYTNTHTYTTSGTKTISLFANRMTFTNASSLLGLTEVVQWGNVKWQRLFFNGASNLTLLPVSEIPNFIEVTDLSTIFKNTGITELPANIFDTAINVVLATQICKGSPVSVVPDFLFKNLGSLKNIDEAFATTNITTIPNNFLKGAISVINVAGVFRSAGGITSIPEILFNDCINLEDVSYAFWAQSITTVPLKLFYYNDKIKTFDETFRNNPITSRVPELWMRYPNATSNNAFGGVTGADNVSTIPTTWGGTYTGGYGKMLSAYIWSGSQVDLDAQSLAFRNDANILKFVV